MSAKEDMQYEEIPHPPNYAETAVAPKSHITNDESEAARKKKIEKDAWAIVTEETEDYKKFSDMTSTGKILHVVKVTLKILGVILNLYLFICSLSLMSSAFQVLSGQAGGQLFTSDYLGNPIVGLIVGILVTVLVQSSSTSTSIITTMVGAGILQVHEAIPIIMGANIGTSVTNTIVSLTQSMDKNQFRRAFAGATVHDMFNFLSVMILLPIEVLTGYLEKLTTSILKTSDLQQGTGGPELLNAITDPLTDHVIRVNKSIITLTAQGIPIEDDASMVLKWCEVDRGYINRTYTENSTECLSQNITSGNCTIEEQVQVGVRLCETKDFLFANTGMSDPVIGVILLVISLVVLCSCLIFMVKLLSSMLKGSAARVIKKVVNTNIRYPFGWVSGYLAIIAGAILTFLFQSSSVFTSTMTPLVGLGIISLKRMYPLTLGSNIGTTATSLLAALATETPEGMLQALQISLCHFFFNISGIIIWYPLPFMRHVPIRAAKTMGNTTARYKWFAVLYLIFAFFLIPTLLLALSYAGVWIMGGFLILAAVIVVAVVIINLLQSHQPQLLPTSMQTWDFLPLALHSLQPYDKFFTRFLLCCKCCKESEESDDESINLQDIQEVLPRLEKGSTRPPSYDSGIMSEKLDPPGMGKSNMAFTDETYMTKF